MTDGAVAGGLPRVAMLGSFPPQTQGIPMYCGELAKALSRHCEVHALGFRKMYPPRLFPGVQARMDPTYPAPEGPHLTLSHEITYYNVWHWLRLARTTPADVFHAQWWSLPLWPVTYTLLRGFRARGVPRVLTIHNVLPHERRGVFIRATRALCRLADRIVVHGEANLARFGVLYPGFERRVREAPHGTPAEDPNKPSRESARAVLDWPADAAIVLFFGIIRPYKGVDTLIRAFADFARARPDALLVIAGRPWTDWGPYARLIEELGLGERVRPRLDYVPAGEVANYVAGADLVVLPYTHFDAQSGVASLCLPYKTPMIVSSVGGLRDSVGRDPEWLAPPGDADALAARIRDFFERRTEKKARFAALAERVLSETSFERVAERHAAIYRELLGEQWRAAVLGGA